MYYKVTAMVHPVFLPPTMLSKFIVQLSRYLHYHFVPIEVVGKSMESPRYQRGIQTPQLFVVQRDSRPIQT